ncbi:hypothetical protein [Parvularcula sp. LCG005]|uniref:hypothetical protein n=1 Tax=Parvularcula sp. LCG005 TaxID=3078805 RepID=UPI00294389E0|nr:hypothetical protein [Parvularcula sp. LCG005]WOI52784.1 hypothetical protein RUI03_11565 [Parvularcula sp. LCG005]
MLNIVISALSVFLLTGTAFAQSLLPMKADIVTFAERGNISITLQNPYERAKRFTLEAYDMDWQPLPDIQMVRRQVSMAPGGSIGLYFFVPQREAEEARMLFICATSNPTFGAGTGMRGRVCGKYRVVYRSL